MKDKLYKEMTTYNNIQQQMTTKATKDYSRGKIYKIEPVVEHDEGDIYIGSTTKKYLSQRMTAHRKDYKRWKEGRKGFSSSFNLFEKYGIDNCEIIHIEDVKAKSYEELVSREAFYVRTLRCVNVNIPYKSIEERKEEIIERSRQYTEKNKERIQIYQKKYREEHKEETSTKNKEYREKNKESKKSYNKAYYENNKEKIKEQNAKYKQENRDEINRKQKKKQENESLGNI